MHSQWRDCLLMFDFEVYQRHRRCPVHVSHSTWLFPVCLKCRLYHQHKHKFWPENSNPVWKQWCQSHHGNCSYKLCLFFHSPLLPLSMWHSSAISFCHNALGISVPMPRTQKGKNLTFRSAPNARWEQGQEVCLWALSGVGGCVDGIVESALRTFSLSLTHLYHSNAIPCVLEQLLCNSF